jgi:hypothetical protein
VEGWNGDGCGKRYGSKLALEEHIRTSHLGFLNAKAERRQRLGLSKAQQNTQSRPTGLSALAALTGEGYAEETGRQIACFFEACAHRFHRDYDLWVHMGSKHGCVEDEIRDMFMQRALLAEDPEPLTGDIFGIYGLEFDNDDPSYEPYILGDGLGTNAELNPNNSDTFAGVNPTDFPGDSEFDSKLMMRNVDSRIPTADDMAMIDPLLAYNMMDA